MLKFRSGERLVAVAVILLGMAACAGDSSTSAITPTTRTILVTNSTCASGHCDAFTVYGFPDAQLTTPGGLWSVPLGVSSSPTVCLTIPATASFSVIGVGAGGKMDTTVDRWTSAAPFALGVRRATVEFLHAVPSTAQFTPSDAQGWSITLPGDTVAVPAAACHA